MDKDTITLDLVQLRRSYEISRLKWALKIGLVIVPLTVISIIFCGNAITECTAGMMLYGVAVFSLWKGKISSKAVKDGFLIGSFVYLMPFFLCELDNTTVLMSCPIIGIIAGILLFRYAKLFDQQSRKLYLKIAIPIVSLFAVMGGIILGFYYVTLIISGVLLVTIPSVLWRRK